MSTGDWVAVGFCSAFGLVALASVIIGITLFYKPIDGKVRPAYGVTIVLIGLVAIATAIISAVSAHRSTVETRQASAEILKDHPAFKIKELAVSYETITYVDYSDVSRGDPQICTTKLFHLADRYLVATKGAQCAVFH